MTSNDMVVREGTNVTLMCKARGYPEPYVSVFLVLYNIHIYILYYIPIHNTFRVERVSECELYIVHCTTLCTKFTYKCKSNRLWIEYLCKAFSFAGDVATWGWWRNVHIRWKWYEDILILNLLFILDITKEKMW